jgi:hypothetical protein
MANDIFNQANLQLGHAHMATRPPEAGGQIDMQQVFPKHYVGKQHVLCWMIYM